MNQYDVAAIRADIENAWLENAGEVDLDDLRALCDALERAEAALSLMQRAEFVQRERAERAEATVEHWKGLADYNKMMLDRLHEGILSHGNDGQTKPSHDFYKSYGSGYSYALTHGEEYLTALRQRGKFKARAEDAEAALARVRALDSEWVCPRTGDNCGDTDCMIEYYDAEDVRAALGG